VATLGTLAVGAAVVLRLPADYFQADRRPPPASSSAVLRPLARVARNALGLVLILVGGLLALPGIPGQGLLTMLIGLMLVEFPGRRRLERRLAAWPGLLATLNGLRARFGKPPLMPPGA
jgi:hypothetical protein